VKGEIQEGEREDREGKAGERRGGEGNAGDRRMCLCLGDCRTVITL